MTIINGKKHIDETLIKFRAPKELKQAVRELANERNIALSALLRLIVTEYVKRHDANLYDHLNR